MSRSLLPSALVAMFVALAAIVPACGTDRGGFVEPSTSFGDDSGVETGAECATLRCSRDLKKVLRGCAGDDSVVETCGPDQGCGDGRCIEACAASELSKGSIGCSFATLPPDEEGLTLPDGSTYGSCFAAMIANTWDRPVTVSAMLGGAPLDISRSVYTASQSGGVASYTLLEGPLPPDQVAIVFLASMPHEGRGALHITCPSGVTPAFTEDPIAHGTTKTRAFRLTTSAPVSAYSIYPYGGATSYIPSATLLLPISAWDTSYVGMSSWSPGSMGRRFLQIVAKEDGTEVRLRRPSTGAPSVVETWMLGRGEVAQITESTELTGSFIESDKPVGLFGGSECSSLPGTSCCCDTLHQQIPAVSQWGSEYALVPYRPRNVPLGTDDTLSREMVPWRIVGAADGTTLTYEPEAPGNAPLSLQAGEVATFLTNRVVSVRSQDKDHPFYAGVFMTSAGYASEGGPSGAGGRDTTGDPDFVNIVASDQFLDRYVFFADYTYPETTLTVVRRKTQKGFLPVELDCAGAIGNFQPLGTSGNYEFAWVYLTSQFVSQGQCGYGRHEAHSDGPFSLTVWGTGPYASYGYASGTGSRPLTQIRVAVPR